MKKYIFPFVLTLLCICSVLLTNDAFLNAENTVTEVGISISDNDDASIDNILDYSKAFNSLTSPYDYFTITLYINDTSLSNMGTIDASIASDFSFYINESSIDLSNPYFEENDDFECVMNADVTFTFTPKKPMTYNFAFYYKKGDANEISVQKSIITNPVSPEQVAIKFTSSDITIIPSTNPNEYTSSLNYDLITQPIKILASLDDYLPYIDSNFNNISYTWSIPRFNINSQQSKELTLTKDDIMSTGEVEFTCSINLQKNDEAQTNIAGKIIVNITTSSPKLIVKNNDKITTLKAGTNDLSTTLSLQFLVSEDYTAQWFRRTPNSTSYVKIKDGKTCTIDLLSESPQTNGYGEYFYIVVATTKTTSTTYISEPTKIVIEPSDFVENSKYYVKKEAIRNTRSNAQAYKLTLTSEDGSTIYLDRDKIIWVVVGANTDAVIGTGLSAVFEPQTAGTYIVDVKLISQVGANDGKSLLADGRIQITSTINSVYKIIMWSGIAIAVMAIALTISIIITTKKRELIW